MSEKHSTFFILHFFDCQLGCTFLCVHMTLYICSGHLVFLPGLYLPFWELSLSFPMWFWWSWHAKYLCLPLTAGISMEPNYPPDEILFPDYCDYSKRWAFAPTNTRGSPWDLNFESWRVARGRELLFSSSELMIYNLKRWNLWHQKYKMRGRW